MASLASNCRSATGGRAYYKGVYELDGQQPSTEYWVVPLTGSTGIGSVRAKLMPPTIAAQVLSGDVAEGLFGHKVRRRQEERGVDAGAEYDSSDGCRYGK